VNQEHGFAPTRTTVRRSAFGDGTDAQIGHDTSLAECASLQSTVAETFVQPVSLPQIGLQKQGYHHGAVSFLMPKVDRPLSPFHKVAHRVEEHIEIDVEHAAGKWDQIDSTSVRVTFSLECES
jgi:hypothetical protein